jgi:hypothetical protein
MDGRGVMFTLDLIAAMLFFLIILLAVFWLWSSAYRHMGEYRESNARQAKLQDISSMLVKTQGNPPDWQTRPVDPDSTLAIGLASSENVLDAGKLQKFADADYERLREIMGLGGEDFSLTVAENYSGAPVVRYSVGAEMGSRQKSVVRRYALLNGTRVELKLTGYYNMTR